MAIFEKDQITRFINQRLFSAYNPTVELTQCPSLETGLQIIKEEKFDIIIVDWHISHDTEAILSIPQLLTKLYPQTRIITIALADLLYENHKSEILKSGYDFCWLKPLTSGLVSELSGD